MFIASRKKSTPQFKGSCLRTNNTLCYANVWSLTMSFSGKLSIESHQKVKVHGLGTSRSFRRVQLLCLQLVLLPLQRSLNLSTTVQPLPRRLPGGVVLRRGVVLLRLGQLCLLLLVQFFQLKTTKPRNKRKLKTRHTQSGRGFFSKSSPPCKKIVSPSITR